jgi:hypothetical protein
MSCCPSWPSTPQRPLPADARVHDVMIPGFTNVYTLICFCLLLLVSLRLAFSSCVTALLLLGLFWGLPRSHRLSSHSRLNAFVIQNKLTWFQALPIELDFGSSSFGLMLVLRCRLYDCWKQIKQNWG